MKNTVRALIIFCIMAAGVCCMQYNVQAKDSDGDIVIVIDPGHGGDDPGKVAVTGVYEKDCTYATALEIKKELETYEGVKVYLTHGENEWISNTARAMVASALDADFLISVHYNSGSETSTGCIAFASVNQYYSEATTNMCRLITDKVSTAMGIPDGGVQTRTDSDYVYEDYYTLMGEGVRAGVPSIIVEHCFLSNPDEAALVTDGNGSVNMSMMNKIGTADAAAIAEYFGLSKGTGSTDTASKKAIALVGVLDPTFYYSDEEFEKINLDDAFGVVIYSDGTAQNIALDSIGDVDYEITGIQDIEVKYNNLTGYLRVVKRTSAYTPEVTSASGEKKTEAETTASEDSTTVSDSTDEAGETETAASNETVKNIKDVIKYIIILVVIIIIATIIIIIESKRRSKRRRKRRRR